jgi:glycosyltransferase involved in cell wall biosynthesis
MVGRHIAVLHLLLTPGETSAPYNEHCLAAPADRDVSVCSYFEPTVAPTRRVRLFAGDGSLPGFFRALKRAIDAREYDVVHAHSPHVGFLYLAARTVLRPRSNPLTVYTVHSSYPNFKLRHRMMLLPVFARFDRLVSCSYGSFESFPRPMRTLGGTRFGVVQNGVDVARIRGVLGDALHGDERHGFAVASVGRLIPIKNPMLLLRAFHESTDGNSRLVFIGDGPLRPALRDEIDARRLGGQVTMTGLIPRDAVYRSLSRADLLVSASVVEGLPVSVLEAMACGCPVVLSDIAPHREIAGAARVVPLVRPHDAAGFAREIRRFRQMSPSERREIGDGCRSTAEERFSLTAMHRNYDRVYAGGAGRLIQALGTLS